MELSDFIERTLVDINKAVANAVPQVAAVGGAVNPTARSFPSGTYQLNTRGGQLLVLNVDFDVAVSAGRSQEAGGRAGIEVLGLSLGLGVDARTDSQSSSISRIRFSVPVALPTSLPPE